MIYILHVKIVTMKVTMNVLNVQQNIAENVINVEKDIINQMMEEVVRNVIQVVKHV